jgi:hypothetical protein
MATSKQTWAGMAKETAAHQMETIHFVITGWVELLKTEDIDQSTTLEIEKTLNRLQTITERLKLEF